MKDAFGVDRPDLVSKSLEGRRKVSHALSNPLVMAPVGAVVGATPIVATTVTQNALHNRGRRKALVNDRAFTEGISRPEQIARYKAAKVSLLSRTGRGAAIGGAIGATAMGAGALSAHHLTHKGKS